jgi:hypothetical protein
MAITRTELPMSGRYSAAGIRPARPNLKPKKSGGTRLAGLTVTLIGTPHQRDCWRVRGRGGGTGMANAGHAADLVSQCNFAERNAGTFKRLSK